MRTQDIILGRITEDAEAQGYVVADNRDYGNVGWLVFMDPDTLDAVTSMHYYFTPTYYNIEVYEGKPSTNRSHKFALYTHTLREENSAVLAGVANAITRN